MKSDASDGIRAAAGTNEMQQGDGDVLNALATVTEQSMVPVAPGRKESRWVKRKRMILALVACGWLASSGCSRNFWRTQADFDAYNLLSQKQFDPHWVVPRTTVEPDPRSRFYDPYDKDMPPLPPDDAAASRYMEWVNGIRGYKSWHKFGRLMSVENPQWLANFGIAPDTFHDSYILSDGITMGTDPSSLPTPAPTHLVPTIENLTLAQTIELSSIHSRDYQTQLENLYLSALQLSLDQFQFNVRYLTGRAPSTPSVALPGTSVPTGILNNSTIPGTSNGLGLTTSAGVSQILPTGGQWIVGFANNTLWLFSGGQNTSSQSLLSYSLVQPLLAGGGRKFFLENLTFSERNVLYNVRILSRYRRLFFADAVVNNGGGSNSSPAAISASSSSTVVNPVVISTNAGINVAAGTTVGSTPASASGQPAGYFGLLYQLQQVLNQHENVELFRIQAQRLRELVSQTPFRRLNPGSLPNGIEFPAKYRGRIDYVPINHRLRWLDPNGMTEQERDELLALDEDPSYRNAIREIFVQLRIGVTTLDYLQVATQLTQQELQERRLKLAYDDEIDQFKFFLGVPIDMQISVDRSMLKPFELTDPLLLGIESRLLKFVSSVFRPDVDDPDFQDLKFVLEQFSELTKQVQVHGVDLVAADIKRVEEVMPSRLEKLLWGESKEAVAQRFDRDALIFKNVNESYSETASLVESWLRQLERDPGLKTRQAILSGMKDAREDLLQVIQNLRVLQTGLRSELITLVDFDMSLEEAMEIALENRVDLMNSRARVMDARRNMEVAANRLEAVLNLVASGNINTPPNTNHPLDFRGANSNYQFGVQVTAPLDQVQVRNAYRQSIINYQQARRAYMLLEDQVKYDIRTSWRQLKMNAQNFETTRKALRQAALQLDINVANNLNPKQNVAGQAGTTGNLGATGINLVQALGQLLTAQNNLIQIWTLYERNRINIYRDMDIMEIDERGLWIDPQYQDLDRRGTPLYTNESAHDVPPEPAPASGGVSSKSKPSRHPGIVRLSSFSDTAEEKARPPERDRGRRRGGRGNARLAPGEVRLVPDHDGFDTGSGSDRGPGDRDREDGDLPSLGGREGVSRQHEERGADE